MTDLRISLDSAVTEIFDNNKLLKVIQNSNITATELAINEESSHLFQKEILKEANIF